MVLSTSPVGVIDIGSNSVRIVVYDGLTRSPISIHNEKMLCGLARNMQKTKKLHPDGVACAKQVIGRFVTLAKRMGVDELSVFATSAVRDAEDGEVFVAAIEKTHAITIQVLTGEEEAYYAALGVMSSFYDPQGVVGDLGGGSLELVEMNEAATHEGISVPVGPLRLLTAVGDDIEAITTEVDKHLAQLPLLKQMKGKRFYAIGGGFRGIAKIHITRSGYPLKVLHNYHVDVKKLKKFLREIYGMSKKIQQNLPGVNSKRVETLSCTALILERILEIGKPSSVVFSSHGVREGILYSTLSVEEQQRDPLIAGCETIMERGSFDIEYGYDLYEWVQPLLGKLPKQQQRLCLAACILSELAVFEHTEYREEMAFRRVIDSSLVGVEHFERVFMAITLFHRYKTSPSPELTSYVASLLNKEEYFQAMILGLAMRLARNICGGAAGILPDVRLEYKRSTLTLFFKKSAKELIGEVVEKRLARLAEKLGVEASIEVE